MADVNWHQYKCNICLSVGLTAAAVASAVITALLAQTGMSIILLVILFLVVWGVLFKLVDGFCASRLEQSDAGAVAAVVSTAAAGPSTEDLTAKAAQEAAAEQAAADEQVVEERVAAETKAAADQAAADQAAAEKAAAEAKLQVEREEAAKAEAEAAAERVAEAERAQFAGEADYDGDGVVEGKFEGTRPEALDGPRDGVADDLKRIKGVGPKMEILCNSLGFYHFDQIANWKPDEIAWVDANLEGFKGRVTRDEWVSQAKLLASGGETEFSKRVDEGDVPSSQ